MYIKFAVAAIVVLAFGLSATAIGTPVLTDGDSVKSSGHALAPDPAENPVRGTSHASGAIPLRAALNGSLRRELDAATGVSPAPATTEARSTNAAAGTTADPDEVFWDGYELCGDGVVDQASEECDRSDLAGTTCITLSYGGGVLACDKTCHFDTSQCTGTCLLSCNTNNDCGVCGICFQNLCLP